MSQIFKMIIALALALALSCSAFAQSDFEATKARAEGGDAQAQYELGLMYERGEDVRQNNQEAVKWYRLAAEQGDAMGQYRLGYMYSQGKGVDQNLTDDEMSAESAKWTRLSANQGNVKAQMSLGLLHQYGVGVAQNDQEAVKWFRLAAEQGEATSIEYLAIMDREGRGTAQNDKPLFADFSARASACEEYVKSISTRTNRYTGEVSDRFIWNPTYRIQGMARIQTFGNNLSLPFALLMLDENGSMIGDYIDYWCVTDENTGAVIEFELANQLKFGIQELY